jgi:CRISPR-associated protein Csb2
VNDASQVTEPDREKLDAAEAALLTAQDAKQSAKAARDVEKLRAKHRTDTAKAIAVPAKFPTNPRAGLDVLPDHRGKQPRTFPSAAPSRRAFAFVWPNAEPDEDLREHVAHLASRLVRLGHSSSQVCARVVVDGSAIEALARSVATYRPDERDGDLILRWVAPGQLARLRAAFGQHRETEPRVLPARFVRYTSTPETTVRAIPRPHLSDDFVVFARSGGARLPITAVAGVARQLRRALMSVADQPVHPILSGHLPDGSPAVEDHLAIAPLPVVLGPVPDGSVLGIALSLPRRADAEARRAVMRAIGALEERHRSTATDETPELILHLGAAGDLRLRRIAWDDDGRVTLTPATWTRPSRTWATATPIALDRNPGNLHDEDASRRRTAFDEASTTVRDAVVRTGLPAPAAIDVVRSCVLPGTAKPRAYPRFPRETNRTQRVLVHARLVFEAPVAGPMLLGAGRYHGLGLCLPVDGITHSAARSR